MGRGSVAGEAAGFQGQAALVPAAARARAAAYENDTHGDQGPPVTVCGMRYPVCGPGRRSAEPGGYARGVDPKTRNRIMAAVLVLMFAVVAVAAALG